MGKNDSPVISVASWLIRLKPQISERMLVPDCILTYAPSIPDEDMPQEASILLPTHPGPQSLIELISDKQTYNSSSAIGLFMSDPFLAVEREARRLIAMGVTWVCNLPTVEQHDEEFTQQLADVGLDRSKEYESLRAFKSAGLKIAAAVSNVPAAKESVSLNPDALIVIPRTSDFAAGFPSPRQRGAAAQLIKDAINDTDWNGPLLGYGDEREIDHPSQWPECVDGMLFRPIVIEQ